MEKTSTTNYLGARDHRFTKKDYPINPDICAKCQFRVSEDRIHIGPGEPLCQYMAITHRSKPGGSTHNHCVAFVKGPRIPVGKSIHIPESDWKDGNYFTREDLV